MNAHQESLQTHGHDWGSVATGARAYRQSPRTTVIIDRALQPCPFKEYEKQIEEVVGHCAALDEIRKSFVHRNATTITRFLQDHRTIPQLLLESLPHLRKHFGSQTVFVLKTMSDEDGTCELCATAMWPGNARKAMDSLNNFNDSWWIEKSRAAGGRLIFTYELE